jgi:hypothetical protein
METLKSSLRKTARRLAVLEPAFAPIVTASLKEVRHAQRLRERIEKRYLNRPAPSEVSLWSVGAD